MAGRNITLRLEEELLDEARLLAAQRKTSVSGLVRGEIERLVGRSRRRREAWRSIERLLEAPPARVGKRLPPRDALHAR